MLLTWGVACAWAWCARHSANPAYANKPKREADLALLKGQLEAKKSQHNKQAKHHHADDAPSSSKKQKFKAPPGAAAAAQADDED